MMVGYYHKQMVQSHMAQNYRSSSSTQPLPQVNIPPLTSNDLPQDLFASIIVGEEQGNISLAVQDDSQGPIIIGKTEHWRPHQVAKLQPKTDPCYHNNKHRQYRKKRCPNRNHLLSKYPVKYQKHRPLQQPPSRQIRFHSKKFGGRA
jgi:hypothetical protein